MPGPLLDRVDRLQQRHGVLGFPHAVVRKYFDDAGPREAALITYYGFLSIFPVLLLGVTIVSLVLAQRPDLRERLVTAIVPPGLQSTVEESVASMPSSQVALAAALIGLLLSGAGVVFAAYRTLNHLAAVPFRLRSGFVSRYARGFVGLVLLLAGAVTLGALTVVTTALPGLAWLSRAVAVLGSCLVAFAVLLLAARLLLDRKAPVRALWPAAATGGAAVTLMLNLGAVVLPAFVQRAGPVYGSFATVAGMFSLLYLLSQSLVFSAEVAAVRHARLWPRALVVNRPTAADARALALLVREQERLPFERTETHLTPPPTPPAGPTGRERLRRARSWRPWRRSTGAGTQRPPTR